MDTKQGDEGRSSSDLQKVQSTVMRDAVALAEEILSSAKGLGAWIPGATYDPNRDVIVLGGITFCRGLFASMKPGVLVEVVKVEDGQFWFRNITEAL